MAAHVLIVPFPAQGHMNPMVQFAKRLASKGVATTLVTTRFIQRTAGVDAHPSCAVSAVYYHFSQGRLAVPPPVAVDGDGGAARSEAFLGLPEMERSEFLSFVFDHGPYPTIAKQAPKQFAHEGKDDWVLFNSYEDLESEVLAGLTNYLKARAIGPCVPLPAAETTGATGRRITYGANLVNPEDSCIKWLDTKPHCSVAYVSFGSFASLDAAQTEELARGLLAAGKPFLWVVRATDEQQVPRHLLDDATASGAAMVVPWCPHLDVLAHPAVGCFVTHCGWNSTLEALSYGVPMVAMALWTDQPTNARNVELAWGAGVRARHDAGAGMFLHGEVERCVRAVMDDGEAARKWRDMARAAVAPGDSSDRNLDEFVQFARAGATEKCKALVLKGGEVAGSEM
ncbi:unnamed protein product [Miscanthus lutarioriparius]|uniref:Glycosyltransferase N-terminal domain-containing protein n=1 Tax=Miscanthus lutarioriparius TaxID=422564 RepID=A0A811MRY8_9POAL|nr:unnamed protein product [Miscanthus lutarioriparius]